VIVLPYFLKGLISFRIPNPNRATLAALSDSGTLGNVTYVMQNLAADNDVSFYASSSIYRVFSSIRLH
jgi:hypothetical protein